MSKINVKSLAIGEVSVFQPSIPFKASWPSKGSTRQIEEEVLEQLMYTPGFEYMINKKKSRLFYEKEENSINNTCFCIIDLFFLFLA